VDEGGAAIAERFGIQLQRATYGVRALVTVTRLKLHDAFDPDMQLFDNDRFQKYLRFGVDFYEYSEEAYHNGIESFPMRSHEKRRLPCAVQIDTRWSLFPFKSENQSRVF
jgi:hypothetical protein